MVSARVLLVLVPALLLGGCKAHADAPLQGEAAPPADAGAPDTEAAETVDTEAAETVDTEAAETVDTEAADAVEAAGAVGDEQVWHVSDNGVRCITWPCANWTLRAVEGTETTTVTDLDLSALGLEAEARDSRMRELAEGRWEVRGRIEAGRTGPAGPGRVLRVTELISHAQPPATAPTPG